MGVLEDRCKRIREQPAHFSLIAFRLMIFFMAVAICWLPLRPINFLSVQTAVALVQCAALHISDHRLNIKSSAVSLESKLAGAVNVLSLRAKHSRDQMTLFNIENRNDGDDGMDNNTTDGRQDGRGNRASRASSRLSQSEARLSRAEALRKSKEDGSFRAHQAAATKPRHSKGSNSTRLSGSALEA